MSCCILMFSQVSREGPVSRYKGTRRLRATCWFAQTALSHIWYETAGHRSTAPKSARRSRKTSTVGGSHFFLLLSCLWIPASFISLSIYIFLLFITGSSPNYFPCVPTGLSTFKGTTGNATCFLLTASPTVWRRRPTSTSHCMKKKVNAVTFRGSVLQTLNCGVFACCFSHENIHIRCIEGFTASLSASDCRLSLLRRLHDFKGLWVFCWHNKSNQPPSPPPPLLFNHPGGGSRTHKHAADLSGV